MLAVDGGSYNVKTCGECGLDKFQSAIGEYNEGEMESFGADDMVWEYKNEDMEDKGFAGTIARYESVSGGSRKDMSKNNYDGQLRILLGVHRYLTKYDLNPSTIHLMIGQPIETNVKIEADEMKRTFTAFTHQMKVNGVERILPIKTVTVVPECAISFQLYPVQEGIVHFVDVGGSTINYATYEDGKFIRLKSGTIPVGMNTAKNGETQLSTVIRSLSLKTHDWGKQEKVFVLGGIAKDVHSRLIRDFPNAVVLYPTVHENGEPKMVLPTFSNAIAMYRVGVQLYGQKQNE